MKNKIYAVVLVGVLGIFLAPSLIAGAQKGIDRNRSEFKQISAKNVQIIKKMTIKDNNLFESGKAISAKAQKGRPATPPGQADNDTESTYATGILGDMVSETGNRYAIVIGIANYPGTEYDLRYTDEDAKEMGLALSEYGFLEKNITMLVDEGDGVNSAPPTQATAQNIFNAILAIKAKVTKDDEVVFFFSGHGGTGEAEDGDAEITDESIWVHDGNTLVPIWDGQLREWFADFPTSRIIFAFDSCRAGGMNDVAAEGRIVNMATTETGTAYEFSILENGQFSHYFIDEGMLQGLADTNLMDEIVTIEEAFDYTKANYRPQDRKQSATISDGFINDLEL